MNAFNEGYGANSLYENPYWINYPKKGKSPEDEMNALRWIDGYVQKIIDLRKTYEN